MNFILIPPVTPLDVPLFDILLQTKVRKKIRTSQITPSSVFTQRMIHSVNSCFQTIYLAFSHSNVLTLPFSTHNLSFDSFGTNQTNHFFSSKFN